MIEDHNCISYWLPPLQAAGLPVPRTTILQGPPNLIDWLDGARVLGGDNFLWSLATAVIGHQGGPGFDEVPVFLRTGHTSGKHRWETTCHLTKLRDLELMVANLVEESAMSGIGGLPTEVWAVRDMIETRPLFVCRAWNDFPVTREFRLFVDNGQIAHLQPYWPEDAIEGSEPDAPNWERLLRLAARLGHREATELHNLARLAWKAVTRFRGTSIYWSVDILQDRHGQWWITDMAEGERSFRYEPHI